MSIWKKFRGKQGSRNYSSKQQAVIDEYKRLSEYMVKDASVGGEDGVLITGVRQLWENRKSQSAVVVARDRFGNYALHQINKDGRFSKRGPFWIKPGSEAWRPLKEHALVVLARAPEGAFYTFPRYPNTDLQVHQMGIELIHSNCERIRFVEWKEFCSSRGLLRVPCPDPSNPDSE